MGQIEKKSRKLKSSDLQKAILQTVATAGVLSVGLVAPNVLKSMHQLGLITRPRQAEYTRTSARKLVDKGLLVFDGKRYKLTKDGENVLRFWELSDFKFKNPRKWDRKWRVIIFDIPENKKSKRDQIRNLFLKAGLRRLQDSVWVYPYDCEDVLTLFKTELGVGKNLLYLIADEIENDKYLREEFGLPK